ncbi:MAG: putative glutamine amidotransferase [Solirubrobacteraceae bacterium]|jgi:RNA polymerase sigma factor (sigma-70 family)|nr:putative glutamine amidotransferase [Solirubrobacteraceae bacterium]
MTGEMTLERVFAEQEEPLRRRLVRMTGDRQIAEDLCQEVFVRAWRSAPRDAPAPALSAWLHRAAANLAVDELRRRARRPVAPVEHVDGLAAAAGDDGAAREALSGLVPHDRLVLLLRFEAGLSLRELGAVLDISEEAARKRVARARRRFGDLLAAARRDPEPLVLLLVREDAAGPYEAWLRAGGARVRTTTGAGVTERDALFADALVVSGSRSDVHPRVYGERPGPALHGEPDVRNDWRDLAALRAALRADLPVVGICRGHQLLNVLSGGTLVQDLGSERAAPRHPSAEVHAVRTTGPGAVRAIVGRRSAVPNAHHQAIRRLGRRLRVSAVSDDGVVEGIERTDRRFAVGIQWKPQLVADTAPSRRLAEALVEHAREGRRAA